MTRKLRPWVAMAAALGAALTLTSPASGAGQAVTDPLATWAKGDAVTVAPGVTHTVWTETDLTAGNRAKARKLQIVEINPTAGSLTLESTVGTKGGSAEQVSDQLAAVTSVPLRHPYAGVNGGLFQREPAGAGVEKTAAHTGVSATDGVLHSSSCWNDDKGTTGAVIQYGIPYITKLLTDMKLIGPSGEDIRIDDVNRTPGRPPHCARDSEDEEVTESPPVFTDADEIVVFTDDYGLPTPKPKTDPLVAATADAGFEVVVDAHGVVTRAREGRGGTEVPEGGRIIQGIGAGAQWLRERLVLDDRVTIDQKLRDVTLGRNIPLDDSVDVVSSFHQLLGHSVIPDELPNSCSGKEKGAVDATKLICTDSRTALGTNSQGHPVLVTLTGQDNEDGDYLRSFAALLDSPLLGIVDALNLDGGGSTALVTKVPSADPTKTATIHTPPTDLEDGKLVHRKVADSVYTGVGGYGLYAKP
ncbi:phosphodiester glycosidase family protein [Streptomyces sp. NPDC059593]|uniref:phosphodiester glycosidase family protein n=1 Tax=Streptomyces sp. NPDC059593 TaxID=3346878 RepID=UPI0036C54671